MSTVRVIECGRSKKSKGSESLLELVNCIDPIDVIGVQLNIE